VDGRAPHLRAAGWLSLILIAVLAVPAVGASGRGGERTVSRLRAESARIASARHSTTLALYALDSSRAAAGSRLSDLDSRAAAVRAGRADVAAQFDAARSSLAVAEQRLGDHLRALYEQGNVTPLDVFLGARSLDQALTALDNIDRAATADRALLGELRTAQTKLRTLGRRLAAEQAHIDALRAQAAAAAAVLAAAQADRSAYLSQLSQRQSLTQSQIGALQARSAAAQAKAVEVGETVTQPAGPPAIASPGARSLTVDAVAYSLPGKTYIGLPVGPGVVAVDPSVIPLGTRMEIPGYGAGIAADIGSAVKGPIIDVWFPTLAQARAWGRRTVTITLHG
jgi:3D (Asp-Asp-Asp) domain-containing protein/peptidoglycan hydrolase CwlO-like protein